MLLHLKPCGKLKLSIKATWLRNATVDSDALTEVTAPSMYADSQYDEEGCDEHQEEEQDLSGFDPETGEPLPHHRSRRGGAASTSGGGGEEYDEYGNPSPARKSKKHRRKRRPRAHDDDGIPEDAESTYGTQGGEEGAQEYGDPGGGGEEGDHGGGGSRGGDGGEGGGGRRGRAGSRASKGEGRHRLQVYGARPNADNPSSGGGGTAGLQIEAGRQLHKPGWRDYLCCCLPRHGPREDPLEGDSLLVRGAIQAGNGQAATGRRR
ncbi:hypothetical protein Vretifemale_2623 [Volvox reticuliferus]|nr:hypothetical protein Vretifemale_2623 [Volvox reticuliferus]